MKKSNSFQKYLLQKCNYDRVNILYSDYYAFIMNTFIHLTIVNFSSVSYRFISYCYTVKQSVDAILKITTIHKTVTSKNNTRGSHSHQTNIIKIYKVYIPMNINDIFL